MRKAILHLKQADPVLAGIIEKVGPYKISYDDPAFASLAEAIVYQQLHGKAAAAIFRRLTDLTGLPLGVMENFEYQAQHVELRPGDSILLFTDGITDAMNVQNQPFQMKGIHAALQDSRPTGES